MSVVDFRPLPLSRPLVLPAVDSLMSPAGRGGFRRTTAGLPSSSYTADKPAEHREAEASTHGHTASEEARIRSRPPCRALAQRHGASQSLRLGLTVATWHHRVGWSVTG